MLPFAIVKDVVAGRHSTQFNATQLDMKIVGEWKNTTKDRSE